MLPVSPYTSSIVKYGEPKNLEDLKDHRAVNYVSRTTAKLFPFEFMVDGELKEVAIEGAISVFGAQIYAAWPLPAWA